jgi:two-component system CheB/CheR fusion protein
MAKRSPRGGAAIDPKSTVKPMTKWQPCPIVGVGASAGGLEAFSTLLAALPEDTGMAYVLVQHLDPNQESALAEILGWRIKLPVIQITSPTFVEANHVYVIPPNATMSISGGKLHLQARGGRHERYMPIDAFLYSLAGDQKNNAFGVILSGAASDGTLGLKAIKDEGGITFAQDERSARFPSMPRSAIAMGAVDFVLPPEKIARQLASLASAGGHGRPAGVVEPGDGIQDGPAFQQVFTLLREYSGVDFTHYKQATVKRRMARRMAMHRAGSLDAYLPLLEDRTRELGALFEDLLINVTEFFRDPETFEFIRTVSIPELLKNKDPEQPVRVWVPACSTGEEVYSLAICLREAMGTMPLACPMQIFGTDVSETVIGKARAGIYSEAATSVISPERLRKYFIRLEHGYQVHPSIRDCCVFSAHNVTKDPPLSRMDMISCRNLLIYLGPVLQKRVIATFHYAMAPSGCLILGASETPGSMAEYFTSTDSRQKVFCRKPMGTLKADALERASTWPRAAEFLWSEYPAAVAHIDRMAAEKEADRLLLAQYAPAGFLVDEHLKIIEFRGLIGPYLGPAPGEASYHLLKMLRDDLTMPVRDALELARRKDETIRKEGIHFHPNGELRTLNLAVVPVSAPDTIKHYLVLFEDPSAPRSYGREAPALKKTRRGNISETSAVAQLEEDLANTRQYLQSIIEELRAANEEIQSSNEELQSTNEELQTAKEELQSTNEELTTINDEMKSRNAELSLINNDLVNLLSSISVPIVMLGSDLRVRRFTPLAQKIFNLIPADIGRPILDIKPSFESPDMEDLLRGVMRTLEPHEREVVDRNGRWHLMRIRPYRTTDDRIDGVVLQMLDIDALKRSLDAAKAAREYAEAIVDTVRDPLVVLDPEMRVQRANRSFYQTFRTTAEETESRSFYSLGQGQWDIPKVHALLDNILEEKNSLRGVEIEQDFGAGMRTAVITGRGFHQDGNSRLILMAIEDITERKRATEARFRRLFEAAQDGVIIVAEETGEITDVNPYMLSLLGYAREKMVGRKFSEIESFRRCKEFKGALAEIAARGVVRYDDLSLSAPDGSPVRVEVIANVYTEGEQRVIQFNVREIGARKDQEHQLRQTAKLESLGLLAGGIAHDFNNLLTGIMGNASLAVSDIPPESGTRRLLEEVVRASERAADLTRQMLAYAGKGQFVIMPVNFSHMIRDIGALIHTSIPRKVTVGMNLRDDLPSVLADPGQMQQIVMNLIINAAESIRHDTAGAVTISTSVVQADEPFLRANFEGEDLKAETYVCLQVTDSGIGMDEQTRVRIFDPFFTTKFTGRGLGLAAVQGIVRGHKGGIRVKTAPGQGTTFEVIFPAARIKTAVRPRAERPRKSLQGSGTVLVIDDEKVVRKLAKTTLERHGYTVILADNGETGAAKFRENADAISLVILDMTMPVMAGPEALKLIKSVRPDVPVILSSGYNESEALRHFDRGSSAFIQKPYTAMQLAEKAKAVLG